MPSAVARNSSRASVFVIEDDQELSNAVAAVLMSSGYSVESVPSAQQALAQLEAGPAPDVILFDLMMPGMSGWEFRVEQRLHEALSAIPVVAMSADDSSQARAIDANAYLRKPFQTQELVDTIERVLVQAERARLAAHTAEFERLRSLGLLAAGIAHEINNPLTFVAGNAELVRGIAAELQADFPQAKALPAMQRLQRCLDHLDQGVGRIATVVRSIATFSRPNEGEAGPVNIHEVMTATIRLVSNELRHRAKLRLDLEPVPDVLGNPAQLGQVFLNLLINAMHAIPEGASGAHTVTVSTRAQAGLVSIEVSDTGSGMPAEVIAHIFEPFFTTKPIGRGMGLGLSISHGIVGAMGGTIAVRSEPGEGSTFRIDLPAHRGTKSSEVGTEAPSIVRQPAPPPTGRHRVLVVDDEPMICSWLDSILQDTCEVVALTSSREALQRIVAGEVFDVVLCDLMMPELTGMDLFDEVRARRADMADRLVFMTGGAFTEHANTFLKRMSGRTLRKPFRLHELFAVIESQSKRASVLT
jgi:signal transduction histidine kinase